MKRYWFVWWGGLAAAAMPLCAWSADFSAPLIDLPTAKPVPGKPLQIHAIVDDDNGVMSVVLFYRVIGESKRFESKALKPVRSRTKLYGVSLPASLMKTKGIEYYVEAKDVASNITQEPFPNSPRKLVFGGSGLVQHASRARFRGHLKWGAGVGYANLTVDDPDGDTDSVLTPNISGIFTYQPHRLMRVWTDVSFQQFQLAYSQSQIGQDVRSIHADLIAQFRLVDKGWAGVGAGLGFNRMDERATANGEGFLKEPYNDRSGTNYNVIVHVSYEVGAFFRHPIGLHARFYKSQNNDIEGYLLGMYFLFSGR